MYEIGFFLPIIVVIVFVVALIKDSARENRINRMIEDNEKEIFRHINKKWLI